MYINHQIWCCETSSLCLCVYSYTEICEHLTTFRLRQAQGLWQRQPVSNHQNNYDHQYKHSHQMGLNTGFL